MTKDTKLSKLIINKLTTEQYNSITTKDPNQLYIVTDAPGFDESRTNCITGISQDIKLELKDGTLTLKAGSKLYIPNGLEGDEVTPKFDEYILKDDFVATDIPGNTVDFFMWDVGHQGLAGWPSVHCYSGDTRPTVSGQYAVWYDTKNNVYEVKYESDTWTSRKYSLPICIATGNGTQFTSLDQVFNGFGYIGSTVFALPGVKGLIPNGRNTDGSLKNIEIVLDNVTIVNNPDTDNKLQYLMLESNGAFTRGNWYHEQTQAPSWVSNNNNIWYNPETNKMYYYRSSTNQLYRNFIFTGLTFSGSDGSTTISKFNQAKLPFCAVDRSNSSWIAQQAMPSGKYINLTLGASGSTYTAPANGWVIFGKAASGAGQYIQLASEYLVNQVVSNATGNILSIYIPVLKGKIFKTNYSVGGAINSFRFIYAEGEEE